MMLVAAFSCDVGGGKAGSAGLSLAFDRRLSLVYARHFGLMTLRAGETMRV